MLGDSGLAHARLYCGRHPSASSIRTSSIRTRLVQGDFTPVHAIDEFTLSVIAPDESGLKPDATVWVARAENDAAVVLGDAPEGLAEALEDLAFGADAGQVAQVPGAGDNGSLAVVVGLGSVVDPTPEDLRRAAGVATRALAGRETALLRFPAEEPELLSATLEGASLGAWAFRAYKSSKPAKGNPLEQAVVATGLAKDKATKQIVEHAAIVTRHAKQVRALVNTSPADLFPETFAEYAQEQASGTKVKVEVWDEKRLAKEGFGGIIGVGRGSERGPRLVKLSYEPSKKAKHLSIVGKGITFDTGGISLKPAGGMEEMKSDMTGAATTLHAVLAAAELGLSTRVTGWLCLAENMPSGSATRPGDVLTMYKGTTVEVTNTDAEGRLVLGDGLTKASEENPDLLLDIATLTGAQLVALGARTAGIMGDDEATAAIEAAAETTGELLWSMPIPEEIRKDLDSVTADLRNSGDRNGGMLKAAAFLREFVGTKDDDNKPTWGHIDIAGPSFNNSAPWGHTPKEGTGYALRTLVEVAANLGDN